MRIRFRKKREFTSVRQIPSERTRSKILRKRNPKKNVNLIEYLYLYTYCTSTDYIEHPVKMDAFPFVFLPVTFKITGIIAKSPGLK